MITISLDEYGNFEEETSQPLFIAGLIFDDQGNLDETEVERKRIEKYYRAVINSVPKEEGEEIEYPEHLHSGAGKRGSSIYKVKSEVSRSLPEFIHDGTYHHKPLLHQRKGRYYLFVILKSEEGKKRLLLEHANMLARDDFASNRYLHMAGTVVNRILFHNPLFNTMPSIQLDIASRATCDVADMSEEERKNYYRLAYGKASYYQVANSDVYRTLIAQEMLKSGKTCFNIERFHVRSIRYSKDAKNMEYLYLADSICSFYADGLRKLEEPDGRVWKTNADEWLPVIVKCAQNLNSDDNLIFAYDEIDNDYADAWDWYEKKDYFEALSVIYDAKRKKGIFAEFYRDNWFKRLEDRICNETTISILSKAVNSLTDILRISNLNQEKLVYLLETIERMGETVLNETRNKRGNNIETCSKIMFYLYNAGVTAYCHIGEPKEALNYYEKTKQYAYYVGADTFLRTNNMLVVCLEDSFEWEKALKIAKDTVKMQKAVSEIKNTILGNEMETTSLEEAKSISQMARVLAEIRNPEAEIYFLEALDRMQLSCGTHQAANYKITQSYLLHFYADMGLRDKFEAQALDYFDGKTTYIQRLKYILDMKQTPDAVVSKGFALYVLIRGLWQFDSDLVRQDDNLWKRLCDIDTVLAKKDGTEPGGHPWEITYKYLELLAIKRGDEDARRKFRSLRFHCLRNKGVLLYAIEQYGNAEVANFEGHTEERDVLTEKLAQYLKDNFASLSDVEFSSNTEQRYLELGSYFTFMYR